MIAMVFVGVVFGTAAAEVRTNKSAGISIDVPSAWKVDVKGEVMSGESADKAVALMFWVVDKSDAKEAMKLLDKQIDKVVKDGKWEKPSDITVNGMKGLHSDGTGTVNGKAADMMVAILGPTPTKKGIIIFAAVEHAKLDAHKAELKDIFASLKAAK